MQPDPLTRLFLSLTGYPQFGDADLYIWRHGSSGAPDYWSNLPGTATEQLVFTAVEGEYLIEVHGYASALFTLDIATSGTGGGLSSAVSGQSPVIHRLPSTVPASKPLPAHPLVSTRPGEATPGEQPQFRVFLPVVMRW